jgi:hypothetical protein
LLWIATPGKMNVRLLFLLLILSIALAGRPAPAAATLAAATLAAAAQTADRDWRFGLIETYESPNDATTARAAWTRVKFHWAITQAGGPGSWTPPVSETKLDNELAAGRLVVGLLIGIPNWARDENRLPRGLYLAPDDPANTWANYVRQAATTYHGRIHHWIIWNEPDVWDAEAPGHTWDGTIEDFLQLHRTAYLVIKEKNPEAQVHLTGLTYHWDARYGREQYLARLLQLIVADPAAAAHGYYFDALTAHFYFQPDQIFEQIQAFHAIRAGYGIPYKPIWLVETNAPPINDPAWRVPNWTLSVTQDEQAAFMPQALAVALAAGAERIAVYKLRDLESDAQANPEPFGLVRLNGSRRPAFTTYQVATRYLAGMESSRRERWDGVAQIRLHQGNQTTTVLFARLPTPQQAQVKATATTATLADMWGNRETITAVDGFFTVDLQPALCTQTIGDYCMIGGTVYYLVQFTAAEVDLPPIALPPPAFTPTPEPTPTVPPTATPTATPTPAPTATIGATAAPPTVMSSPAPATLAPAATPSPAAGGSTPTAGQPGYWFLGAGFLLMLLLAGWWYQRQT